MEADNNLPFGYEMMQDPDVVDAIMKDVAKLMNRNAELYGMYVRAKALADRMYQLIQRGQLTAAANTYEAHNDNSHN